MSPLPLALPLVSLVVSTLLATAIVARDPGLRIHRLLGALLAAAAWWSLCEVLWQLQPDAERALFFLHLSSLGWMGLGPLCLHVYAEMTGPHPVLGRRFVPLGYASAAIGIAIYHVTPAARMVWTPEWGWGYELASIFYLPYAIAVTPPMAVLLLWRSFVPTRGVAGGERRVSRWMFAAVVMGVTVTSFTEVLLPTLGRQWVHLGTTSISLVGVLCAIPLHRYGFSLLSPAAFAQEILDTLGDGIALLYLDGRIRFANRALADLVGVASPVALRDRHVDALLPGLTRALTETSDPIECALETVAGARIPVAVAAVRLGRPVHTSLVVRDLREAWSLRDRIVTAGRLAAVGELSAAIGQEIQRPAARAAERLHQLRRIWMETCVAVEKAGEDERLAVPLAEGEELIEECIEGVARVRAIARAVGSFERGEDEAPAPANLNVVVDDALRMAAVRLPPTLVLARDYGDPVLVRCVAREIGQVVLNLVSNASDAVKGGGRVRVRTGAEAGMASIEVADDGPGMSDAIRERIFDPFFTTKPVGEGTGLGLAIAFHIVERHGGEIRCESEPGIGTRITVRLPLHAPATPERGGDADRRGGSRASLRPR